MNRDPIWIPAHLRRRPARAATYIRVHVDLAEEAYRREQFLEKLPEHIEAELERAFFVELS